MYHFQNGLTLVVHRWTERQMFGLFSRAYLRNAEVQGSEKDANKGKRGKVETSWNWSSDLTFARTVVEKAICFHTKWVVDVAFVNVSS